MPYTLSVFAIDTAGGERTLCRLAISEDSLGSYLKAPSVALDGLPAIEGKRPAGFRITDGAGRLKIAHTGASRARRLVGGWNSDQPGTR